MEICQPLIPNYFYIFFLYEIISINSMVYKTTVFLNLACLDLKFFRGSPPSANKPTDTDGEDHFWNARYAQQIGSSGTLAGRCPVSGRV